MQRNRHLSLESMQRKRVSDRRSGGYTLVEMLVAVSIFTIVMTIATGSLLSLVDANRKARSLNTTMTNFNFAMDAMARDVRTGYDYRCEGSLPLNGVDPRDCSGGGAVIAIEGENGDPNDPDDQIVYHYTGSALRRSQDSGNTWSVITTDNLDIQDFAFYVTGSGRTTGASADTQQPHVTITSEGVVGENETETTFRVQTTVTQRVLDF